MRDLVWPSFGARHVSKMTQPLPPVEYLRECFVYDEHSGSLVWKHRPRHHFNSQRGQSIANSRFAGKVAGCHGCGYMVVRLNNRLIMAHRIIWEMHHGPIPDGMLVDHVNGVRHDNRIKNMRLATKAQNGQNRGAQKDNTSGYKGVYWDSDRGSWVARIAASGNAYFVGRFTTAEEAHEAYCKASKGLHGEFAKTR